MRGGGYRTLHDGSRVGFGREYNATRASDHRAAFARVPCSARPAIGPDVDGPPRHDEPGPCLRCPRRRHVSELNNLRRSDQTWGKKTTAQTDTFHGRFVRLVADTEVVQTLEFETDDPGMQGEMTIPYTLADVDGGTLLVGVHENLPPGLSPAANELGWSMSLDKLGSLVQDED